MKYNYPSSSRGIGSLLTALLLLDLVLNTQGKESPPQAVFRFANASSYPDKVFFTIDTTKLRPDGYGPGESASTVGILAGTHRLSLVAAGAKPAETSLTLQANTATTILAYTKLVLDPLTRLPIAQLQLFSYPDPPPEKGKHFYLIYASSRPAVELLVNGQSRKLAALHLQKIDDIARGTVKVESVGKSVLDFTANENGAFLIVAFDKVDGSIGGIMMPVYN